MKNNVFTFDCGQIDIVAKYILDEVEFSQTKWKQGPLFPKSLPIHRSIEQLEVWDGCIYLEKKISPNEAFFLNFEDVDGFLCAVYIFQADYMKNIIFDYNVGSGSVELIRKSDTTLDLFFYQEIDQPLLIIKKVALEKIRSLTEMFIQHMNQEFLRIVEDPKKFVENSKKEPN